MNPLPIVLSIGRRNPGATALFILLITIAMALGVALSISERAMRRGSADAADKFDIVVAAPGNQTALLMSTVYLRPDPGPLLDAKLFAKLLADPDAEFVAPIGFGDSFRGAPIVGTTGPFILHLAGALAEGRLFLTDEEAVVGSASPLAVGESLKPVHGQSHPFNPSGQHEHGAIRIVGRMAPTGTPWDTAIITPIEQVWAAHGLPSGRPDGSQRLGPPFDADSLSGVPAVVVKPKGGSIAKAYQLRQRYRGAASTAFFPAEVLVQLYGLLGDARKLMSLMALISQGLVLAAILVAVLAILQLNRQRLALLRALGAGRLYIFAVVWTYITGLVASGAVLGIVAGALLAQVISAVLTRETGIVFQATLGGPEWMLAGIIVICGSALALIPAILLYRRPLAGALNG